MFWTLRRKVEIEQEPLKTKKAKTLQATTCTRISFKWHSSTSAQHLHAVQFRQVLVEEQVAVGEREGRQRHELQAVAVRHDDPPVGIVRSGRDGGDVGLEQHVDSELVRDLERGATQGRRVRLLGI